MNQIVRDLVLALLLSVGDTSSHAAEKVTFLTPAPLFHATYAPWVLAQARGYFAKEGIEVGFQTVGGGAEVAKQVGVGNAEMGDAIGDASIIVRAHGVPIKSVAAIGGGSITQIIVREDSPIKSPADLKGKTITVLSYQDTTYYALLGALARFGLTKDDVNVIGAGPSNIWTLFLDRKADAMACLPDYIAYLSEKRVKIRVIPISNYFETMALTIVTSDKLIGEKPELIRHMVRAALHGMKDVQDDIDGATRDFVKATPENEGKEAGIREVFDYYDKYVYSGQKVPGEIDPARLKKLQEFYIKQGLVDKAVPIDELYSNAFIK